MPINKAAIENYFDFINAYEIAVEDSNFLKKENVVIDLNVSKNPSWGGNAKREKFILMPFFAREIFDANYFLLTFENGFNFYPLYYMYVHDWSFSNNNLQYNPSNTTFP